MYLPSTLVEGLPPRLVSIDHISHIKLLKEQNVHANEETLIP